MAWQVMFAILNIFPYLCHMEGNNQVFRPNPQQQAVIDFTGGKALVLAAPGCGKTEILSHRILKAHRDYNVPYADMLCLTFTNRASREMRARVRQTLGEKISDLFIGNLHRFCIRFLYENQLVPIDTGILDDTDQADIIRELAGKELLNWEVSSVIGQACIIREHKGNIPFNAHSPRRQFDCAELLAHDYIKYLRANHLIDYDDILYFTYASLCNPAVRSKLIKCHYSWIQVDEVQDLNPLQLAIIELLASPDATIVYLGDERQSIYSFMGAKRESLQRVMNECRDHIFHLNLNYRSPIYMLDMLNDYAVDVLKMSPNELPDSVNNTNEENALQCVECIDRADQRATITAIVGRLSERAPEERTAVLVRTNKEVEELSEALSGANIPHLAITNSDIFKSAAFKTIHSHFCAISLDTAYTDWARLLFRTGVLPKYSMCRQLMDKMRRYGVTPRDLIDYDNSTYVLEYARAVANGDIVVFDTETTGIDTFNDDIIQIAACRMRQGQAVPGSEIDLMIRTDKPIPPTLADGMPNPMVEEYARREALPAGHPEALLEPETAFGKFLEYVGDSDLLGHNVNFDVNILRSNMRRRSPDLNCTVPKYWDTLALARRLDPNLRRHNLASLLERYNLEGVNSHNATDDVFATTRLAQCLYKQALDRRADHRAVISAEVTQAIRDRLRSNYGPLFAHTRSLLDDSTTTLTAEMDYIHSQMVERGYIDRIEGLHYMLSLFDGIVINTDSEPYFAQQLANHLHELRTFNEADLYQNGILDRNIHVMTIHKAKGLQFDNVILVDISKDKIPHSLSRQPEEDARLLYVGLSRARRRIIITFGGKISPFIANHPHIEEHFSYMSHREKERLAGRR